MNHFDTVIKDVANKSFALRTRVELEKRISKKAISEFRAAGYTLGVNDGDKTTIKNSTNEKAVLNAMFTTDEDYLLVYQDGKQVGWVRFVYGNSGYDVICDYTTNIKPIMQTVNDYAESLEKQYS